VLQTSTVKLGCSREKRTITYTPRTPSYRSPPTRLTHPCEVGFPHISVLVLVHAPTRIFRGRRVSVDSSNAQNRERKKKVIGRKTHAGKTRTPRRHERLVPPVCVSPMEVVCFPLVAVAPRLVLIHRREDGEHTTPNRNRGSVSTRGRADRAFPLPFRAPPASLITSPSVA
jgi:hypothetical protein